MNQLLDFLAAAGARMLPYPATEPAPGLGSAVGVCPDRTWISLDPHRADTTVALLVAPSLEQSGFMPNIVGTTSLVSPAVDADRLLDALVALMDQHDGWRVRADHRTGDPGARTMDLLGVYREGSNELVLSSLVTVVAHESKTMLHQIHVTTHRHQLGEHAGALAAMRIRRERGIGDD